MVVGVLASCTVPTASNGFSPRGNAITLGSQSSVDVVVEFDKYWSAEDFASMRGLIADSATFSFENGTKFETADAFIAAISSDTLSYDWNFSWAFAIKDDNAEITSEWVNAGFDVTQSSTEGEVMSKNHFNEWYLIENGKIQYWFNTKAKR